jgi:predicted nucleic acid-binding protein
VHRPGARDVIAAIEVQHRLGISFWDAMIGRSATELGCDVLWSEDLADGRSYDGIVVRSPFR